MTYTPADRASVEALTDAQKNAIAELHKSVEGEEAYTLSMSHGIRKLLSEAFNICSKLLLDEMNRSEALLSERDAAVKRAEEMSEQLEEIRFLCDGKIDIDDRGLPNLAMQIDRAVRVAFKETSNPTKRRLEAEPSEELIESLNELFSDGLVKSIHVKYQHTNKFYIGNASIEFAVLRRVFAALRAAQQSRKL